MGQAINEEMQKEQADNVRLNSELGDIKNQFEELKKLNVQKENVSGLHPEP